MRTPGGYGISAARGRDEHALLRLFRAVDEGIRMVPDISILPLLWRVIV